MDMVLADSLISGGKWIPIFKEKIATAVNYYIKCLHRNIIYWLYVEKKKVIIYVTFFYLIYKRNRSKIKYIQ